MDFPWGSLWIPQLVIPINALSSNHSWFISSRQGTHCSLWFPRWPPNVVAVNTFQPQISRRPVGFGEGISTIWQEGESSCINEHTSRLRRWCSAPGAHSGTRESGRVVWLGVPDARGGSPRSKGLLTKGCPSLRSVFQARVLSCGFLHGYGAKAGISLDWQVPQWMWAATFSSTALVPLLRQLWWVSQNTSCYFLWGISLSLK